MTSVFFDPAVGGDGSTVTDDANPATGLANGGHRDRFVPALQQTVAVAAHAKGSASAAAGSAASALNAPGTNATSTTSVAIGTGSKSLTIQPGKAFAVGSYLLISAGTGLWMLGSISSYDSGTGALVVNIEMAQGSGTYSSWAISPTAPINASTVLWALGFTPGNLAGVNVWTAANSFDLSPAVPAPAVDDNSTKAINSAWYVGQASTSVGAALGTASAGASKKWARADHVHPVDVSEITGDFSNSTYNSRRKVRTSVPNGATVLTALPNGSGSGAAFLASRNSDLSNATFLAVVSHAAGNYIESGRYGSGSYLPLSFYTNGTAQWQIDTAGRLRNIGNSQPHLTINRSRSSLAQDFGTNVVFDTLIAQLGGASISGDYATYSTPVDGVYSITARVLIMNAGSTTLVELWLKTVHASLPYSDAQIVLQEVYGGGSTQEFSFSVTRWFPAGTAITLTRPYGVPFDLSIKVAFASLSVTLLG